MADVIHDAEDARDTYRQCPVGTRIQSLVFDRDVYTEATAASWAKRHGFVAPTLDVKTHTIRIRQEDPDLFVEGSIRTIRLRPGVKATVGCPRPAARENPITPEPTPPAVDESCGCTPKVELVRSEGYEACLASAAKLGALRTPRKVYTLLQSVFEKQEQETFVVVPLDARYQLRGGVIEVHKGAIASVAVSSMTVMRAVVTSGASSFIVAHGHPSGKCSPSRADRELTKHLEKATKAFSGEVLLLDHIVVGRGEYYSIRENRLYHVR